MSVNTFTSGIEPLLALIAGILILIMPGILNIVVAVYLMVIGVLGLLAKTRTTSSPP